MPGGAQIEGADVDRLHEVETAEGEGLRETGGVDATQGVGLLPARYPRRAEGESAATGGDFPFAVGTIYRGGVGFPIIALASGEQLEAQSVEGARGEAQTAEVVVDAERGFFVSAQHEAGTQLFVVTAEGDFGAIEAGGGVKIGHAGTAEGGIEAGEGLFHVLGAQSCLITAAKREAEVEIGVAEHAIVGAFRADTLVILGHEGVGAQAAVQLQGGFGRSLRGLVRRRGGLATSCAAMGCARRKARSGRKCFMEKGAKSRFGDEFAHFFNEFLFAPFGIA